MKKLFLAIFTTILLLTSCESNKNETKSSTVTTALTEESGTSLNDIQVAQDKGIPTGLDTFDMIVSYIWKNGFNINGKAGKQYTFFDSKGNRHAYLATKLDQSNQKVSSTGTVKSIITYGYYRGIKDQQHFFPYIINSEKVYNDMLGTDEKWNDADAVRLGYREFLEKIQKES